MTNPVSTTLNTENQKITADALQGALVDLIDLSLIGKQAHWTVIGKDFVPLHQSLDELVDTARNYYDMVAERSTAIGVAPDGRAATVTSGSGLKGYEAGWTKDRAVVEAITDNLGVIIERMRVRIKDTEVADPVTQDLFIEITAELEKAHWMWQVQLA
ncbi:Dps family protein [Williamsia sp. CHRR-6]|uniref:Dps family protein n=1 Tax=Williamsia sp. CHRR-6 TaxID=2835871 RepID=UPI001BDA346C|nr:DNA starvation/stationary phase protection protein [Williamsia sp. CHRR-6]MBT0567404.1 DNA starvation/stationary phase protection protein [Williamsia sp. CHRR-6]